MDEVSQTPIADKKLFKLNMVQTWLLVITLGGGAVTAVSGFAAGWWDLPTKIKAIEEAQKPVAGLVPRVDSLEKNQALLWEKRSADHDLLVRMVTGIENLQEQQKRLRQDIKDNRK